MSLHGSTTWLAFSLVAAGSAAGQRRRAEPRLLLQFYGGAAVSQPVLWTVGRQPLAVPSTGTYDTVALERRFDAGLVYGIGVVYFPSTHVGIVGHLGYLALATGSRCSGVYFDPAAIQDDNGTLCTSIQGQTSPLALVHLDLQGVVRVSARHAFSPYLRGGVAVATYETSTIYVEGLSSSGTRVVIDDPSQGSGTSGYMAGAGITSVLGAGTQFHLDVGRAWLSFPAVTGPADRFGRAPAGRRRISEVVFSFGVDFVLDGRRGRRY
jgi:hypothetical protein